VAQVAVSEQTLLAKLVRYAMASMVGVIVGQSCILFFYGVLGLPAVLSNFLAVAISSVPAYLINRYWVWQKRDKNSLRREVIPFWGMAFAGLVLSSIFVAIVEKRTDWPPAIAMANLAGFGVLWIAKFFILDKVLFTQPDDPEHLEPPPIL